MSALADELQRIATAIEAGQLTAEQRAAAANALRQLLPESSYAQRDGLLIEARRKFFGHLNDREASNQLSIGIRRYRSSAWPREQSARACPARIAGTPKGAYWQILSVVDRSLSAERIRRIVGQIEVPNQPNDQ
ncbi:hypothetical protein HU675_0010690 [Bradyrhizobium septentrionale]|uniref:hypothetical protein n=1 Tax=Bradyrhizobium septentrionale TaxID=1404411 RepID=UPI001596FAE8|nr:hypothetical protein [Bradyrhizobium septentrionale]UGY27177.1 hypothetical protein HU675_0010690 [Bradyrhizobium septentrionale]